MFTAVIYSQNPYLNIAISILPWWGFEMFWLGTSLNTSHVRLSSSLYSICFFKTCVPVTVNQIIGKWNVYSVTSMLLNLRISTIRNHFAFYWSRITNRYQSANVVRCGKVYVDYRIKRHTPLPVLYISPPPTLITTVSLLWRRNGDLVTRIFHLPKINVNYR